jgi:formate dehydrogenase subunit gamma
VKQAAGPKGAPAVSDHDIIRQALASHRGMPGALLPVLHAIQDALGYLPAPTVALVAEGLNLSRAEVHGVISFYADFHTEPPGRHVLQLCRAEACQAMGAEALIDHLAARHRVALGETRADGQLTAHAVYCLGNCALSPAVMLDGQPYGRVTPQRLDHVLEGILDAAPHASDTASASNAATAERAPR